jgi:hypothetical protein
MAIDSQAPTSRRRIITAGMGALGGVVATALAGPAVVSAAANGNVQLATGVGNSDNDAATETRVNVTGDGQIGLSAVQPGAGTGVYGFANTAGQGVRGVGGDTADGVHGEGTNGIGVHGESTNTGAPEPDPSISTHRSGVFAVSGDPGVEGDVGGIAPNTDQTGVYGFSDQTALASGVWGDSWQGNGVVGTGDYGVSGFGGTVGVYASIFDDPATSSAYALYTFGKIRFGGRSGHAFISTGHTFKDVPVAGMTTASDVIVTLRTYKSGFSVAAAVPMTGKFRLYLNKKSTAKLYFSYLVIG